VIRVLTSYTEDEDAGEFGRRIAADVAEVPIKGCEDPALLPNHIREDAVLRACKPLVANRERIVSQARKGSRKLGREILVELELHYAAPGMNGITSSRESSAAYAIEARTSSFVSEG